MSVQVVDIAPLMEMMSLNSKSEITFDSAVQTITAEPRCIGPLCEELAKLVLGYSYLSLHKDYVLLTLFKIFSRLLQPTKPVKSLLLMPSKRLRLWQISAL